MTNGAIGQTVTSVDGPVLTVKFKDGALEKERAEIGCRRRSRRRQQAAGRHLYGRPHRRGPRRRRALSDSLVLAEIAARTSAGVGLGRIVLPEGRQDQCSTTQFAAQSLRERSAGR
jgi:hypothetical protein